MRIGNIIYHLPQNLLHLIDRRPGFILPNLLLTEHCTQRCLQCNIPEKVTRDSQMTFENMKTIAGKLSSYGTQGISISGGEPLSHPDLLPILTYLSEQRFAFLHLLTNLYSREKLIDDLIDLVIEKQIHLTTSFDGFDQVADTLRGANQVSMRVMEAIEKLHRKNLSARRKIHTRATVVISQMNIHQIPEILRYFEGIGWEVSVDLYRFSSRNHNDVEGLKFTDQKQLSEVLQLCKASPVVITPHYLIDGFIYYFKGDYKKMCPYLSSPVVSSKFYIHPNGNVFVCIGDKVGNLLEQSPAEILASETWKERLEEIRSCRGCWNTCYTTFGRKAFLFETASRLRKVSHQRKRR